jgi:hypothetical protein
MTVGLRWALFKAADVLLAELLGHTFFIARQKKL